MRLCWKSECVCYCKSPIVSPDDVPRPYGQYDYSQPMGYSTPPMMQPQQPYTGQIYQPTPAFTPASSQSLYSSSFEDEPPLLEGNVHTHTRARTTKKKKIWKGQTES